MNVNAVSSAGNYGFKGVKRKFDIPQFNAGKSISRDEVIKFHEDTANNSDRDKQSYDFYTSVNDIGSGRRILGLPISKAQNNEVKQEMINEITRLTSDKSTLSFKEKEMLRYLYQREIQMRSMY